MKLSYTNVHKVECDYFYSNKEVREILKYCNTFVKCPKRNKMINWATAKYISDLKCFQKYFSLTCSSYKSEDLWVAMMFELQEQKQRVCSISLSIRVPHLKFRGSHTGDATYDQSMTGILMGRELARACRHRASSVPQAVRRQTLHCPLQKCCNWRKASFQMQCDFMRGKKKKKENTLVDTYHTLIMCWCLFFALMAKCTCGVLISVVSPKKEMKGIKHWYFMTMRDSLTFDRYRCGATHIMHRPKHK